MVRAFSLLFMHRTDSSHDCVLTLRLVCRKLCRVRTSTSLSKTRGVTLSCPTSYRSVPSPFTFGRTPPTGGVCRCPCQSSPSTTTSHPPSRGTGYPPFMPRRTRPSRRCVHPKMPTPPCHICNKRASDCATIICRRATRQKRFSCRPARHAPRGVIRCGLCPKIGERDGIRNPRRKRRAASQARWAH